MEFTLSWRSHDGQACLSGSQHATREGADAAAEAWLEEMLAECADEAEMDGILAGRIVIVERP